MERYGAATKSNAAAMQAEDAMTGDPFVNYGQSLSMMQNDEQPPSHGNPSPTDAKQDYRS